MPKSRKNHDYCSKIIEEILYLKTLDSIIMLRIVPFHLSTTDLLNMNVIKYSPYTSGVKFEWEKKIVAYKIHEQMSFTQRHT